MDSGLVQRARGGDREAFRLLAGPLGDRLYAVAVRILRDGDLAADATQHALVTIWRDFPQLRARATELGERAERAYAYYHGHPKSDACDDGTIKAGKGNAASDTAL